MADFQFLTIRDVIPVHFVAMEEGYSVPTIRVKGNDFRHVDKVYINGHPSKEVIVLNGKELLAQVPDTEATKGVTDVTVTSYYFTASSPATRMDFGLLLNRKADGIMLAAQRFFKVLFTTPGTDVFDPTLGVGVQALLGVSAPRLEDLTAALVADIIKAKEQVLRRQTVSESADNRLKTVNLLRAVSDRENMLVGAEIEIVNMANKKILANAEV